MAMAELSGKSRMQGQVLHELGILDDHLNVGAPELETGNEPGYSI